MDIWKWVTDTRRGLQRGGQHRLAVLIDTIPTDVCNERHEAVDAAMPEALAAARALEMPWVELFLRHWHLQSRVIDRMEGRSALSDAVSLLEFAHRDETRHCPQSVCAVQDVAVCYGIIDGVGYAPERLAVSDEALSRIDATWSCFSCISREYAAALVDQGRHAESLAFLEQQHARLVEFGRPDVEGFSTSRVSALLGLGRLDECLTVLDEAERAARRHDNVFRRTSRAIDRARVLARLKRHDEAIAALPSLDRVVRTPNHYTEWADAVWHLAHDGRWTNDAALGETLQGFVRTLEAHGAVRRTLELAGRQCELAAMRGARSVAARALATMERLATSLRVPGDAPSRIDEARRHVTATPDIAGPHPADEDGWLAAIDADRDPERTLARLDAATLALPRATSLAVMRADALRALGFVDEARAALQSFVAKEPDALDAAMALAQVLLDARDEPAVRALADSLRSRRDPSLADQILARLAFQQGRWEECLDRLTPWLAAHPDARAPRRMYADVARRLERWSDMLARLEELVALGEPPGAIDHERMLAGTLGERWDVVRAAASRVGMAFDGEGPIAFDGEACRIRIADPGEPSRDRDAVRTGPVTARVVDIDPPGEPQHHGDVVAFDATPLDDSDDDAPRVYAPVKTLSRGGFESAYLDGHALDPEARAALRALVESLGCAFVDTSVAEQMLTDDEGDAAPAMTALLAWPAESGAAALHEALTRFAADLPHPLSWADLARAAGDHAAAKRFVASVARWYGGVV